MSPIGMSGRGVMEKFEWWMFRLIFYVWSIFVSMKLDQIVELMKDAK